MVPTAFPHERPEGLATSLAGRFLVGEGNGHDQQTSTSVSHFKLLRGLESA